MNDDHPPAGELNDAVFSRMMLQSRNASTMPNSALAQQAAMFNHQPGELIDDQQSTHFGKTCVEHCQNAPRSTMETFGELSSMKGANRGTQDLGAVAFKGGGMHETLSTGTRMPPNMGFNDRSMLMGESSRLQQRETARQKSKDLARVQKQSEAAQHAKDFVGI